MPPPAAPALVPVPMPGLLVPPEAVVLLCWLVVLLLLLLLGVAVTLSGVKASWSR